MCAMSIAANTDGREIRHKKRNLNFVGAQRISIIGTVWTTRPCSNCFSRALATIGQRSMAKPFARLNRSEPIFWLVASCDAEKQPFVRIGGNSFYSGLYVDENTRLSLVDPDLRVKHM